MKLALLMLLVLATCNEDLGRSATLTIITQNKHDLEGKNFNLTALSAQTQSVTAQHQLIRVMFAVPLDGCSPLTLDDVEDSEKPTYIMVQGRDGGCTYSRKRHYAMKAGAMGIIIVDSPKGINNLQAKKGSKFHTFLIPEAEGDRLIAGIADEMKSFVARLNMGNDTTTGEMVPAQIWVSSLNRLSYDYLRWLQGTFLAAPILKNYIDWKPRFAYVSNIKGDHEQYVSSCACGGAFCSPQFHGKASDVVVREDIRNWMIFKTVSAAAVPQKFLIYMRVFQQKCLDNYLETKYAENCASGILPSLGIDPLEINQKIDEFLLQCAGQDANQQSTRIFEAMMLDRIKMAHVGRYPVLIFNHEQLTTNNYDDMRQVFCRKLGLQKQQGCGQSYSTTSIFTTVLSGFFWLLLFVLLAVAGALVVLYFRNRFRREVNKELKMQVSTAVEHYYQLSESSETK